MKLNIDEERRILYADIAVVENRKISKKKIDWKAMLKKKNNIAVALPEIVSDEDESKQRS